ncbi:hypothetical protein MKW94_024073 [Papaver nudicaule]|uniref:Transmembrane protein n=1 Tax=Papaver nudicaule TaxID=74823 RepID=A0AA41VHY6_PAPNU|nr:hypothetical protein [Papaver nudicaule]
MAIKEEEEENKITSISSHSQTLKDWEQIYAPPPLSLHSSSYSSSSIPSSLLVNNQNDDFHIFPPSKHENLHVPFEQQQQIQLNHEVGDGEKIPSSPPLQPNSAPQLCNSRARLRKEVLTKRLDLGFYVLWSKCIRIGSWLRTFGSFFPTATGVVAGVLVTLLYMSWQRRRRRRAQLENKDRLVFLLEQADEKLSQLLKQIVLMNQFLSSRKKCPIDTA